MVICHNCGYTDGREIVFHWSEDDVTWEEGELRPPQRRRSATSVFGTGSWSNTPRTFSQERGSPARTDGYRLTSPPTSWRSWTSTATQKAARVRTAWSFPTVVRTGTPSMNCRLISLSTSRNWNWLALLPKAGLFRGRPAWRAGTSTGHN